MPKPVNTEKNCHGEKEYWKKELNKYLAAYQSPPHPITGVSPAEKKLQDKDSEQKSKGKAYADAKRNTHYSDVLPGDQVLVQQEKKTKLSTPLNPSPYMYVVMSKHDNSLIMQSLMMVLNTPVTHHMLRNYNRGR